MVSVNDKHRRTDKKVKKDRDDWLNRETDNKAIRQSNSLCQEVRRNTRLLLVFPPTLLLCFTTEQRRVKASLFVL